MGHCLALRVVVPDEILWLQLDRSADCVVGKVQNFEVADRHLPDPAAHLERVDASVREVTKQLSPRGLLLVELYRAPGPPTRW